MIRLFRNDHRLRGPDQRRVYAAFEVADTIIEVLAAVMFIIGSICFFYDALQTVGTWFFLVGSIFFAVKPILRLVREMRLAAMGDVDDLAARFKD